MDPRRGSKGQFWARARRPLRRSRCRKLMRRPTARELCSEEGRIMENTLPRTQKGKSGGLRGLPWGEVFGPDLSQGRASQRNIRTPGALPPIGNALHLRAAPGPRTELQRERSVIVRQVRVGDREVDNGAEAIGLDEGAGGGTRPGPCGTASPRCRCGIACEVIHGARPPPFQGGHRGRHRTSQADIKSDAPTSHFQATLVAGDDFEGRHVGAYEPKQRVNLGSAAAPSSPKK